jgi:hypothetical protein
MQDLGAVVSLRQESATKHSLTRRIYFASFLKICSAKKFSTLA